MLGDKLEDCRALLYDKERAAWHAYGGPFPMGTAAQDAEYERCLRVLRRERRAKVNGHPTKVWCRKTYREKAMRLLQKIYNRGNRVEDRKHWRVL